MSRNDSNTTNSSGFVGSSNGRTAPFGGVCRGSTPLPTATYFSKNYNNIKESAWHD